VRHYAFNLMGFVMFLIAMSLMAMSLVTIPQDFPEHRLLNLKEALRYLAYRGFEYSESSMRTMIHKGEGPKVASYFREKYRFSIQDLDKWIADNSSPSFDNPVQHNQWRTKKRKPKNGEGE
jgi:hypothetical protein